MGKWEGSLDPCYSMGRSLLEIENIRLNQILHFNYIPQVIHLYVNIWEIN